MSWGFLSEHSAEFAVVGHAHRIAQAFGGEIAPIYFWKTREGTHHARRTSGGSAMVRAVNVFARRPKTREAGDSSVVVKFNDRLFDVATSSDEHGIPVLAACPLVTSVLSYRADAPCAWFRVPPHQPLEDSEARVRVDGRSVEGRESVGAIGLLSDEDVHAILFQEARPMSFEHVQVALDMARRGSEIRSHPVFGGLCRPITLLAVGDGHGATV